MSESRVKRARSAERATKFLARRQQITLDGINLFILTNSEGTN